MRANEFIIRIKRTGFVDVIPATDDSDELQVMVPPLQQDLEIKKAAVGKKSEVIRQLIDNDATDGDD